MGEERAGFVVALVVVALVALGLLLHGAVLLARSEHAVARSGEALLQASGQARTGLHRLGASHPDPSEARVAGTGDGGDHSARIVGLDREWWLAESVGRDPTGRVSRRLVRPTWILDPVARVVAQGTAAVVAPDAPVDLRGVVEGAVGRDGDEELRRLCRPWREALDSSGVGSVPDGGIRADDPRAGELGLLSLSDLRARIPTEVSGVGTPAPVLSSGRCEDTPWNWGAPARDGGACVDRWIVRAAPGDLVVDGGTGQGLLVVAGDLHLRSGARFRGLVLTGGTLALHEGAVLEGMARAGGGLTLDPTSRLRGSTCAALRALATAAPLLRLPVFPAGGAWTPGDGA